MKVNITDVNFAKPPSKNKINPFQVAKLKGEKQILKPQKINQETVKTFLSLTSHSWCG